MEKSFNKVFCVGFNKTGTTSLHCFFIQMGLKSFHNMYERWPVTDPVFEQHDCFSDGDQQPFAEYDAVFPDSKFVLSTRTLRSWLVSRIRHIYHRKSHGLTCFMWEEYAKGAEQAVSKWIDQREQHHKKILEYFESKPEQLLIVSVVKEDAETLAKRLKAFLEMENAEVSSMPRENVRAIEKPRFSVWPYVKEWLKRLKPGHYNDQETKDYAEKLVTKVLAQKGIAPEMADSLLLCSPEQCPQELLRYEALYQFKNL